MTTLVAAPQRTTPENLKRINGMVDKLSNTMAHLYCRWQDEKDHEDIDDYGAVLARKLPQGFRMIRMHKRPFHFTFSIGTDASYSMYVKGDYIGWRRVS